MVKVKLHDCIQESKVAVMAEQIDEIKSKVNSIDNKLEQLPEKLKDIFASKTELEVLKQKQDTVQVIVYWVIGVISTGIVSIIGVVMYNGLRLGG